MNLKLAERNIFLSKNKILKIVFYPKIYKPPFIYFFMQKGDIIKKKKVILKITLILLGVLLISFLIFKLFFTGNIVNQSSSGNQSISNISSPSNISSTCKPLGTTCLTNSECCGKSCVTSKRFLWWSIQKKCA